ncbi:hypothetical protein GOODEAATRI_000704, partial [Goodea atripinnis]
VDFEAAAQSVMVETLREVKRLRPKALWGFSPFPSCYNSDPTQTQLANYTGQCPPAEMDLNDELLWLWKRSSALFPLLTLEKRQAERAEATEQPDAGTKAAELDPAEIWKKDFQCQWYKSADVEISEWQDPKDGVSNGGKADGSAGNTAETRTASATRSASETTFGGRDFAGTGSQTSLQEVQTDSGTELSGPKLHALLLLLGAGCLCL